MKRRVKILLASVLVFCTIISTSTLLADTPPPPPPSGGHGSGGNQPPGGGAPIGSGIVILLTLGAGYGIKKVFEAGQKQQI